MPGKPFKVNKRVNTSFTLEPSAIDILDEKRGKQNRSSFINDLLKNLKRR